ncbi:MAG: hypothetical protein EZS28_003726 [Streblomastix strix]|uniref:Uncharacterized protein n=1 Tax=Streblomastix strix TaxID=222440 RepID=A0A5J4X0P2_9EUKA|nr:MAG: hypothetical protein EZS28_003726 [Streblomastix strix]
MRLRSRHCSKEESKIAAGLCTGESAKLGVGIGEMFGLVLSTRIPSSSAHQSGSKRALEKQVDYIGWREKVEATIDAVELSCSPGLRPDNDVDYTNDCDDDKVAKNFIPSCQQFEMSQISLGLKYENYD